MNDSSTPKYEILYVKHKPCNDAKTLSIYSFIEGLYSQLHRVTSLVQILHKSNNIHKYK